MSDNMKILGKGLLAGQESLQQARLKAAREQAGDRSKATIGVSVDKVNIGLGQEINQLLSPDNIAKERQERINALKDLIARGQYKPPLDQVAVALAEEISFEIAWQGQTEQQEQE